MTPIQQAIHDVRNRLQLAISNLEMGKPVSAVEALRKASSLLERLEALEAAPIPFSNRLDFVLAPPPPLSPTKLRRHRLGDR